MLYFNENLPELTAENLLRAADAVVERFGEDYVYNPKGKGDCYYVRSDDPRAPLLKFDDEFVAPPAENASRSGCFIGEILSHLGLMTDEIAGSRQNFSGVAPGNLRTSPWVKEACSAAQRAQDQGASWGRCRSIVRNELVWRS